MNVDNYLEKNILSILDIACLAPSVHNAQPWFVQTIPGGLKVTVNDAYVLKDGDPTGRQLTISLGIFTEALLVAAEAFGLSSKQIHYHNDVITITFDTKIGSVKKNSPKVKLLRKRASDRSIYEPTLIDPALRASLNALVTDKSIAIEVVDDTTHLAKIADLTARGIRLALGSPGFRNELRQYIVLPWSAKKRGIAVKSLYIPTLLAVFEPLMLKLGVALGKEASLEKRRWLSASAAIIITASGDVHRYWFEVGRTYLRVSLELERRELSQTTSAALVEASTFHEDIEADLGTTRRIQSVLRVGKGASNRQYSPRIKASDILITSNQ